MKIRLIGLGRIGALRACVVCVRALRVGLRVVVNYVICRIICVITNELFDYLGWWWGGGDMREGEGMVEDMREGWCWGNMREGEGWWSI